MARADRYIIDRDERGIGGELITTAIFYDWKSAKDAWDKTINSDNEEVVIFFARVSKMLDGSDSIDTLDCK